jgi:Na+-driven multidrug efflux pump
LQPCLVLSIVLVGGLRGAGDTRFPLFISVIGSLVIRVSLGWLCGMVLGWGLMGAWVGMFGDMIWRAAMATFRFRSGRWLSIRV